MDNSVSLIPDRSSNVLDPTGTVFHNTMNLMADRLSNILSRTGRAVDSTMGLIADKIVHLSNRIERAVDELASLTLEWEGEIPIFPIIKPPSQEWTMVNDTPSPSSSNANQTSLST